MLLEKETKIISHCDLELVLRVTKGADPKVMEESFRKEFEIFMGKAIELLQKEEV